MSKKTIDITDRPDEWQEGDHSEGTRGVGIGVTARYSGPLQRSVLNPAHLLVGGIYSRHPSWRDVKVTREVDEPSEYIKFTPGSVVQQEAYEEDVLHLIDGRWYWADGTSMPEVQAHFRRRHVFEEGWTLLLGSFEDDDR